MLDHRISKGIPKKTCTSASLTTLNPLTVWITTNCGKFFKRWEYQTAWPVSWETCMQVKKQQLKLDTEQQFSSVQSLSRVQLVATPWIVACQAFLSITNSRSSLRFTFIDSDAIQPSHPQSSPSPPAPNPSQHQSLFQWVNSSHEVAKVLEFQL